MTTANVCDDYIFKKTVMTTYSRFILKQQRLANEQNENVGVQKNTKN